MGLDIDQPFHPITELFRLINTTNAPLPAPLSAQNVTLGAALPMETPIAEGINTQLELTALAGRGYTGRAVVYYPRQDLGAFWRQTQAQAPQVPRDVASWAAVRTALSTAYGTFFDTLDLPVVPFPAAPLPATFTWVVPATSLLFTGTLDLALSDPSLNDVLQVKVMNGLVLSAPV